MPRSITLGFLFLIAITACGKPAPGKLENSVPAIPAAKQESPSKQENPRPRMGEADQIASLIDPAKLATLGERRANPRIQKVTAILIVAKAAGKSPDEITQQAIQIIGWGGTAKGDLTAAAIIRNLRIAESLGSTTAEDIAEMRKGNAATVRKGPYAGDVLSVDHIIPRAVVPQLDNCIANLELMPLRLNQAKGDTIGDRQRDLAQKLHAAGLLASPDLP